jgi:hypothetical protein
VNPPPLSPPLKLWRLKKAMADEGLKAKSEEEIQTFCPSPFSFVPPLKLWRHAVAFNLLPRHKGAKFYCDSKTGFVDDYRFGNHMVRV